MVERRKPEVEDLTVSDDGTVLVPAHVVARLGLLPGASVRVVVTATGQPLSDLFAAGDQRRKEAGMAPLTDEEAAASIDPIVHDVRRDLNKGERRD